MRSSAVAVQISRSEALEATLSSSKENSDLNVIGNFFSPSHDFVKLTSLSDRLSREPASLSWAGVVLARSQRKALRLLLVSILIKSDQHLVLNYVLPSMSCSKLLRSSGMRYASMTFLIGFARMIFFCSWLKRAESMANGRFQRTGDWRTKQGFRRRRAVRAGALME